MVPRSLIEEMHRSRPELCRGAESDAIEFTGERFLPGYVDGSIELHHWHRYSFSLPFVVGKKVLDIACGEGYGCDLMAQVADLVSGVDLDSRVIQRAKQRYRRHNLSFTQGSANEIPAGDDSVDVVVSFETLEHLADQECYWSEIKRVLRRDGVLILSSPNREAYNAQRAEKNCFHVKELTQKEFTAELAARFKDYRLFSQSVVFGSSMEPIIGEGTPRSTLSIDPDTGVLCWSANENLPPTYLVAIASEKLPFLPERTLYTGHYPADAMAALAGGIAERDRVISELKDQLAEPTMGTPALVCTNDAQQDEQAVMEVKRLKETVMEQERVIQAMKALLNECLRKRVMPDEPGTVRAALPEIRTWGG